VTVGDALEWERRQPDLLDTNKRLTGYAIPKTPEAAA
jgi:hypothetical protein